VSAVKIAPSLLSADFAALDREVARVEAAGADWHHVDVMDGHFVPNITIGVPVVEALKRVAAIPLDVHVMISEPLRYAKPFRDAGADGYTFHVEAAGDPIETARAVRELGMRAGITLNPDTPIDAIEPVLDDVDLVLVMSVFPGFGGQSYLREAESRIRAIRELGWTGDLQVDGGIAEATIGGAAAAGADVFVAGTAIYRHPEGVEVAIARLRDLAERAGRE